MPYKILNKKKPLSKRAKKTRKPSHKTSNKKTKIKTPKTTATIKRGYKKHHLNKDKDLNHCETELQKILDQEKSEQLILKDMEGRTYCAVENCDYPALVKEYCRLHFFGLFKFIKQKEQILDQDILTKSYISLINKHSEAVFDYLFKDLASDKDFQQALKKITGDEHIDLSAEEVIFNEKSREVTKI